MFPVQIPPGGTKAPDPPVDAQNRSSETATTRQFGSIRSIDSPPRSLLTHNPSAERLGGAHDYDTSRFVCTAACAQIFSKILEVDLTMNESTLKLNASENG
jgi:hypothetical protein